MNSLESIPGLHKRLKIRALINFLVHKLKTYQAKKQNTHETAKIRNTVETLPLSTCQQRCFNYEGA
jgi:hypothetical protein